MKKITLKILDPLIDLYWKIRLFMREQLANRDHLKQNLKKFLFIQDIISKIIKKTQKFPDKIVSINIKGGLGNQLFEIAFVLTYGWTYSFTPLFKKIRFSYSRVKPRSVYWDSLFRKVPVKNFLPMNLAFYQEKTLAYYEIPKPKEILKNKNYNGIYFNGYFQSEKHFDDYREKLLPILFYINPKEKRELKIKYPEIFIDNKITISIHIRRGDNVSHPKELRSPYLWCSDYYQNAIAFFEEKYGYENIRFVVFSSDLDWSKEFMRNEFPKYKVIFPHELDYLELYLMSCCKHQIIASSTFSWWAAYLNKNPEKIVVAPKNWHDPRSVLNWEWRYMDDWIRM